MKTKSLISIYLLALISFGCSASIPPASVELSTTIGEMIKSAKVSHVNMVNKHFLPREITYDDKAYDWNKKLSHGVNHLRSELDNFALTEYKEAFLANVRKISKERNPSFTELTFAEYDNVIMRVLKKRSEWLEDVEKNRQQVLQALEEHYTVLLTSNTEITMLLKSAANLSETYSALMDRLGSKVGISGTKIKGIIYLTIPRNSCILIVDKQRRFHYENRVQKPS